MSKYIDSTYKIHNNVFIFTPLIVNFYTSLEVTEKNILLAYLVLPMVLYKDSCNTLKSVNVNSSIHTYRNKKDNLFGLPERVQDYKEITNNCLQYAFDQKWLKVTDNLSVEILEEQSNMADNLVLNFKASSNLHKVFRGMDVVTIYKLLGIKNL